jgi:3-hydroxybutyryl-CoA dehydrogenase
MSYDRLGLRVGKSVNAGEGPRFGLAEDAMEAAVIGIVGCGLMGAGLVEVAALAGFEVVAVKATPGAVTGAAVKVSESMARAVAKGRLTAEEAEAANARITFTDDLALLHRCDLVIESAAESMLAKKRLLPDIEGAMRADAILASNTSSLRLAELASILDRPERFLGMHFFSPAQIMKLVEVAPLRGSTETLDQVTHAATAVAIRMGKTPVMTSDEPGYIANRLLVPYLCQAIEMLESGVAGAREIDTAMKLGCGHPLGPLALSDLIGLDVVLAMAQSLQAEHRDRRFRPPSLLRRLVLSGQVGKKARVGLYDYRLGDPIENPEVRQSVRSLTA